MQHPEQIAAARGNLSDLLLVRNGAYVVLIAEYMYALSFNLLPDGPRLAFAGGLFLLNAILAVVAYVHRPNNTSNLILLALLITCVCWGFAYGLGNGGGGKGYSLQEVAKQMGVYMIAIWVLAYPEVLPRRLLAFLAIVTLIGAGGYATLAPRLTLAGEEYFAHITGVSEATSLMGLHGKTSALVGARHVSATLILLNILLVDQLRRLRVLSPIFAWSLILFGTYVIIGYWSRNNMASLVIYFMATFYYDSRNGSLVGPLYFLGSGLFIVFITGAMFFVDPSELYYWGSGRIGTYVNRTELLADRDWGSLFIGTGLGSDWFRGTYTWLSAEKSSHNQYFSVIIETGFLGLIGFIIFMFAIYNRLPRGRAKAFFYMILFSGVISHGFLSGTQFLEILFGAMALAITAANETGWRNPT